MKKYIVSICTLMCITGTVFWAALKYQPLSEIDAASYLAEQSMIQDHRDNPEDFRLKEGITRQETLKTVMKLSWKEVIDNCEGVFSDVKTGWGCKYIEAALRNWYIAKNNTFRANDLITKTEVAKLVLKAKNIEKVQTTKNWQNDYMETLHYYGLIEGKYYDYNENATRGWIFSIVTATLQKAPEIKQEEEKRKETMTDEAL